jgi:hypothetical protein
MATRHRCEDVRALDSVTPMGRSPVSVILTARGDHYDVARVPDCSFSLQTFPTLAKV